MQTEFEAINNSVSAQRESDYNEQMKKRRDAYIQRWLIHVEEVAKILRQNAWPVKVAMDRQFLEVAGIDCSYQIEIKEEHTSTGMWSSRPTGKLRLTVGDYGDRVSYKQKTDGTFSYDKIAAKIESYVRHRTNINDSQDRRKVNRTISDQFRKDNDLTEYGWFTNSDDLKSPIRVVMNMSRNMTVDQATKFVEALKIAGIKPY